MNNKARPRVMEWNEKTTLVDRVFSWSIKDILDRDLYKQKIYYVETKKSSGSSSSKWFYDITIKDSLSQIDKYQPKCGDLIALTKERPKRIDGLNPLLLAYVSSADDGDLVISVHSSLPIDLEEESFRFGVYLMNLTTNTRIWNALHNEAANLTLIKNVLQANTLATDQCASCRNDVEGSDRVLDIIISAKLNSSQEAAILSCLKTRNCNHNHSVKLIWGPPGTGKTKTVATLLFALLNLKCRTIVCSPTNTAVVEVTSRLLSLFKESYSSECATYGLGNVVLSGNRERMGIKRNEILLDVFLDERIDILGKLFLPSSGWMKD